MTQLGLNQVAVSELCLWGITAHMNIHDCVHRDAASSILVAASAWPRRCYGHCPLSQPYLAPLFQLSPPLSDAASPTPASSSPPPHPLRRHQASSHICGCIEGRRWGHIQLHPLPSSSSRQSCCPEPF